MGEWSPEALGGEWIKGATGPAVGAQFKGDNQNGSKSWTTIATVTAWEPARRFEFRVTGPVKVAQWSYQFTPAGAGCQVTETWTDLRNPLIKLLGKPFSGVGDRVSHNRATMQKTLDRLATAAETAA